MNEEMSNIQHPTLNIQHPIGETGIQSTGRIGTNGCSKLAVGCWVFPVGSHSERGSVSGSTTEIAGGSGNFEDHPARRAGFPVRGFFFATHWEGI
jgi:hypothetical protein